MRPAAAVLCLIVLGACSSTEIEDGPLHDYLTSAGRGTEPASPAALPAPTGPEDETEVAAAPKPQPALEIGAGTPGPRSPEALEPAAVTPRDDLRPFFERYLGEYRYDVVKQVLIPIKGGEVVYRFRRIDRADVYPPHSHYYEFEFHVTTEGPGLLFLDEARFVAHAVYAEDRLEPRRFRVGLRDGSFRHFQTFDVDPGRRRFKVADEITGVETWHDLEHPDTVDPVTFFFNLFCLGIDLTRIDALHGHLLHEDESPIVVRVDQADQVAEVRFRPGEFLPQKPSKFRFFFDEKGRIDITRFELEYGSWSMKMEMQDRD